MKNHISILKVDVKLQERAEVGDRQRSYYTGLSFTPTDQTLQVLKDHRFTVKYCPAGIKIHAPCPDLAKKSLLVPIKNRTRLRWLVKAHSTTFFNQVELPPKRGMYYISNDPGDEDRYCKFLDRAKYGEMENNNFAGPDHRGYCIGYIGRSYSSIHQVFKGLENKIIWKHPPAPDAKEEDYILENIFSETEVSDLFIPFQVGTDIVVAKKDLDLVPERLSHKKPEEYNVIIAEEDITVSSEEDTAIKLTYPIPVKGYNNYFGVLDIFFWKYKDDTDLVTMPEPFDYTIIFQKK